MKSFAFYCALAVLVVAGFSSSQAQPVDEAHFAAEDVQVLPVAAEVPLSRQKRATCDLLSYFNVNNSACAAHCLLLGHRGGYCNSKAVCVCR